MTEKCYWYSGPLIIKENKGKHYCGSQKKLIPGDSNCNETNCQEYLESED